MNGRKLFCFKEYTSFQSGGNITFFMLYVLELWRIAFRHPFESLTHSVTLIELVTQRDFKNSGYSLH